MKIVVYNNGVSIPSLNKVYQFETLNSKKQDIENIVEMIWDILEEAGYLNQKWDEFTLETRMVHGRKWNCQKKDCEICRNE